MSIILGHVHVCILLFEIKLPFLLGLFHSGLLVDSGEGDRAFFGTENELRNSVVLQAVTPLSPTAQLVLFILRQHHVNHLVVELQVLLLEANNAQEFCLGVCELLDQVLILRILLVVLALQVFNLLLQFEHLLLVICVLHLVNILKVEVLFFFVPVF